MDFGFLAFVYWRCVFQFCAAGLGVSFVGGVGCIACGLSVLLLIVVNSVVVFFLCFFVCCF